MMKRRWRRDNALNSPTLLLLGRCLQAASTPNTVFWRGRLPVLLLLREAEACRRLRLSMFSRVEPTSNRCNEFLSLQNADMQFRSLQVWSQTTWEVPFRGRRTQPL